MVCCSRMRVNLKEPLFLDWLWDDHDNDNHDHHHHNDEFGRGFEYGLSFTSKKVSECSKNVHSI